MKTMKMKSRKIRPSSGASGPLFFAFFVCAVFAPLFLTSCASSPDPAAGDNASPVAVTADSGGGEAAEPLQRQEVPPESFSDAPPETGETDADESVSDESAADETGIGLESEPEPEPESGDSSPAPDSGPVADGTVADGSDVPDDLSASGDAATDGAEMEPGVPEVEGGFAASEDVPPADPEAETPLVTDEPEIFLVPVFPSDSADADIETGAGVSVADENATVFAEETEGESARVAEPAATEGQVDAEPSAPNPEPEPPRILETDADQKIPVAPSRSVSLEAGQTLEVWYPGRGWVFLGVRENSGGVVFDSRRFEARDTVFLFRALEEGEHTLDFAKFDLLSGKYIEDALLVTVRAAGGGAETENVVRAPDYSGVPMRAVMPDRGASDGAEDVSGVGGGMSDGEGFAAPPAVTEPPAREIAGDAGNVGDGNIVDGNADVAGDGGEPSPGVSTGDGAGDDGTGSFDESSGAVSGAGTDNASASGVSAPMQESGDTASGSPASSTQSAYEEPQVTTVPSADSSGTGTLPIPEEDNRAVATGRQETAGAENSSTDVSPAEARGADNAGGNDFAVDRLSDIKTMLDEGDAESALDALDEFFASSTVGTDEALFLQGQAYEMDGPARDIRRALSAYETLTKTYPFSEWWNAADRRIRYIRRFYFDIR